MLVRFVAVAIIGLSVLEAGLYAAEILMHHLAIGIVHCAFLALLLLLGIGILAKSRAVAEWLSEKLDE